MLSVYRGGSKGLTAATLVTLALCIGATTAIFSTVYSLMLKPLPFQEPERIVELYTPAVKVGLNHMPAHVPFYLDYSKNAISCESVGSWTFFDGLGRKRFRRPCTGRADDRRNL